MRESKRNFAAFILSHGRAESLSTYDALRKCGYTGKIYIIVDDQDDQIELYKQKYKKQVIVFNKAKAWKKVDCGDATANMITALPARNVCFKIAKKLGVTHFVELDDDCLRFSYRYEINGILLTQKIKSLDDLFNALCDFLDSTSAKVICFAQGGDFVGGINSNVWKHKLARKAMNTFVCKTNRPFEFLGRINEDVTTYTRLAQQGELFFTAAAITMDVAQTQALSGGVSEVYNIQGTYAKSFYSVMYSPSCVKIAAMGGGGYGRMHRRIHHFVEWKYCTPCIISEKYRKVDAE